jgi:hypothetical protein
MIRNCVSGVWSILGVTAILCVLCGSAMGDRVGYAEVKNLEISNDRLIVRHHHDWSDSTRARRYEMISGHQDPFRLDNNYAYLECIDRSTSAVRFKIPTPALTYLWISPDSRYIVGLSKIQLWNPYQLVVFDSTGNLLFKEHITPEGACFAKAELEYFANKYPGLRAMLAERAIYYRDSVYIDFEFMGAPDLCGDSAWRTLYERECPSPYSGNFSETVTNWVYWYDETNPGIECVEARGKITAVSLRDNAGKRISIPFSRIITDTLSNH